MTETMTVPVRLTDAIAPVPLHLFGSFVEHMGRCVYTGIYEPGHPTADEDGFRGDVLALTRELGVTIVRYPGGNFVSGYRWEDGVGPVDQRPRRLETAWHEIEPNTIGLHEFVAWARKADIEVMEAVNLGTRGIEDAMRLVEYANHPGGTALSDERRANGAEEPFGIRIWCLGNEMDGPWQLGAKTADEYGRLAQETAKGMRLVDQNVQLVLAGSSGPDMPTFGQWERTILRHAYEHVQYLSLHAYFQERPGQLDHFLTAAARLDAFITDVAAIVDEIRAEGGHTHTVALALDEWNVWNQDRFNDPEHQAETLNGPWLDHPRVIEDTYTVTDAVVVGTLMHTLLRRSDRVTVANQAQLVNVIAPIMTEPGGAAWRQATFWPFARIAHLARGVVTSVETGSASLDAVATVDEAAGAGALFVANIATDAPVTVSVELPLIGGRKASVATAEILADSDRLAVNTLEDPDRVTMAALAVEVEDGVATFELPPLSWACLRLRGDIEVSA